MCACNNWYVIPSLGFLSGQSQDIYLKLWVHTDISKSNRPSHGMFSLSIFVTLFAHLWYKWLPLPSYSIYSILYIYSAVLCLVTQSCLTLCDPMDYNLSGSPIVCFFQARILERVAIPFSGGSSQPSDRIQVSCIAGRFFTIWAARDAHILCYWSLIYQVYVNFYL